MPTELGAGAHQVVADEHAAAAVARRWHRPIALKGIADGLVHRTDTGAVVLGLSGARAIEYAGRDMAARMRAAGLSPTGFLVQEMAPRGVELLVGTDADPTFGPVVAVAAGGVAAELLGDTAVRLTPLTDRDAHDVVRELRTFALLDGHRGAPRADMSAVEQTLLRLSARSWRRTTRSPTRSAIR